MAQERVRCPDVVEAAAEPVRLSRSVGFPTIAGPGPVAWAIRSDGCRIGLLHEPTGRCGWLGSNCSDRSDNDLNGGRAITPRDPYPAGAPGRLQVRRRIGAPGQPVGGITDRFCRSGRDLQRGRVEVDAPWRFSGCGQVHQGPARRTGWRRQSCPLDSPLRRSFCDIRCLRLFGQGTGRVARDENSGNRFSHNLLPDH